MGVLVVLDANSVVSAVIQPSGNPARLIDAALAGAIVPVICPAVASEYLDVVQRPRFKKWKIPPRWLSTLIAGAHRVDLDPPPWPSTGPDPDDLIFLALAQRTGAVLVTGNLADFPPEICHGVQVMDPATCVRHLGLLGVRW